MLIAAAISLNKPGLSGAITTNNNESVFFKVLKFTVIFFVLGFL